MTPDRYPFEPKCTNRLEAGQFRGRQIVKTGVAHIRAIQRTGGKILGAVDRSWPIPSVTNVFRSMPVWGLAYAQVMAERHFVAGGAWEADTSDIANLPRMVIGSEAR